MFTPHTGETQTGQIMCYKTGHIMCCQHPPGFGLTDTDGPSIIYAVAGVLVPKGAG